MKNIVFTTRSVGLLIVVALVLSAILATLVSNQFSNRMADQVRDRDMNTLLGAIESGPVAIAKLNSASIAQNELNKLMATESFGRRNFQTVEIRGGSEGRYRYAFWSTNHAVELRCLGSIAKSFLFQDSINPILVEVKTDDCYLPSEARAIRLYSIVAGLITVVLVSVILFFVVLPVIRSINSAERYLNNGVSGSLENISFLPVKNLVVQAQAALSLQKAKALGDLAEQVAHDIRSPLTALNFAISADADWSAEKASLASKAVARINDIASELLIASRATGAANSYSATETVKFRLNDLVKEMYEEKTAQFSNRKSISFKLDIDEKCNAECSVKRAELARSISNILNNSFESIDDVGEIVLAIRNSKSTASIVVHDNGRGIQPDILERIKSERLSSGKSGASSGFGLGLTQTRRFIESSQGSLSIQSSPGVGTIVSINIPTAL